MKGMEIDNQLNIPSFQQNEHSIRFVSRPHSKMKNESADSRSGNTSELRSEFSKSKSIGKRSRTLKKLSRLSTFKKDTENTIMKVSQDLEEKMRILQTDVLKKATEENQRYLETKFLEMLKIQNNYESKVAKMISNCEARAKEIEESVLNDVLGHKKKNKRNKIDIDSTVK